MGRSADGTDLISLNLSPNLAEFNGEGPRLPATGTDNRCRHGADGSRRAVRLGASTLWASRARAAPTFRTARTVTAHQAGKYWKPRRSPSMRSAAAVSAAGAPARRLFGYACPNRWTAQPPRGRRVRQASLVTGL